jgi:hypothetical protein
MSKRIVRMVILPEQKREELSGLRGRRA